MYLRCEAHRLPDGTALIHMATLITRTPPQHCGDAFHSGILLFKGTNPGEAADRSQPNGITLSLHLGYTNPYEAVDR